MQGYHEILTPVDEVEAAHLLDAAHLRLPGGRSYGLGYYEDGRMVACGFLAGEVLCGICVDGQASEGGLATGLLSRLVQYGMSQGTQHFFIFTKADSADKFAGAGFSLLARSKDAALLELGRPAYADWLSTVRQRMAAAGFGDQPALAGGEDSGNAPRTLGAIVMNANPFTMGHEYLARTAVRECGHLLVFVVEEEASAFPFALRFALVQQGLADAHNILVLPSGPYMVSMASFPAYFTADAQRGAVHAALDCTLFATRIAPDLGIGRRFVGTEPLDPVTAAYNAVMHDILPRHGVAVREVARVHAVNSTSAETQDAAPGNVVSASRVRRLLCEHASEENTRALAQLLPACTLAHVCGEAGAALRQTLQGRTGRH